MSTLVQINKHIQVTSKSSVLLAPDVLGISYYIYYVFDQSSINPPLEPARWRHFDATIYSIHYLLLQYVRL